MVSGLPWGLALSSGVNTYLPLFLMALFARFSHLVQLSPRFQFLVSDQALIVLGMLAACELLAQKFPVLDNLWDFLHTLLRPLAGAVAAGATLNTSSAFETVVAMLLGGTLAAAAHSAKSSVRLASTSKTFGATNLFISLGEDAGVVMATLLSVYAPWVMLGVVILFVLLFALIAPRALRTLRFELGVVRAWFAWLWNRALSRPAPEGLEESLVELETREFDRLNDSKDSDEKLLGALSGWKRARGGPRACCLGITSRRLLLVDPRLFRRPRVTEIGYADLMVARYKGLGLFSRVDLLTHGDEAITLNLRKTHGVFAALAVRKIRELASLSGEVIVAPRAESSRVASVPR